MADHNFLKFCKILGLVLVVALVFLYSTKLANACGGSARCYGYVGSTSVCSGSSSVVSCGCGWRSSNYECFAEVGSCCAAGGPGCGGSACVAAGPTPTGGGGGGGGGGGSSGPYSPKGWQDPPSFAGNPCYRVFGWTCDQDKYSTSLNVAIYANGTKAGGGTLVAGAVLANFANDPGVTSSCGGTPSHRFYYDLPASLQDGASHKIYIYGLGVNGSGVADGRDALLQGDADGSRTINCPASTIPNYTNLTASPASIYVGESTTVNATFTSPQGSLGGQFITGTNPSNMAALGGSTNTPISGNSGPLSYVWTPTVAGSTTVYARAWNDGIAECRPAAMVDAPPKFACVGPGLSAVVTVSNPTCAIVDPATGTANGGNITCSATTVRSGDTFTCSGRFATTPTAPSLAAAMASAGWLTAGNITPVSPAIASPVGGTQYTQSFTAGAVGSGTVSLRGQLVNGATPNCQSNSISIAIQPPLSSWFGGGGGGDMIAANGSLNSTVPIPIGLETKQYFMDQVLGLTPSLAGVALGQNLSLASFDQTNVSQVGWMRDISNPLWSNIIAHPETSYAYMKERILAKAPGAATISSSYVTSATLASMVAGAHTDGKIGAVTVVRYSGSDLSISGDTGTDKIVILADGNVTISGNTGDINGAGGFLGVFSGANMTVATTVGSAGNSDPQPMTPHLKGVFYSNGIWSSGGGSLQLKVEGTVVGMGGVSLGRSNAGVYPSEYFQFNPSYMIALNQIGVRHKIVQELLDF